MMLNKQGILKLMISAAFFLNAQLVTAQDTHLDAIKNSFARYNSKVLHEKIYLHTDKNFYMAGNIAWFSIYNVDGSQHKPIDLSRVAYVELIDQKNKPVLQAKIELSKGRGDGSFHLPISLNSGSYKLRAYTNWMKNFGAAYFFEKEITIVNSLKATSQLALTETPVYNAQFFPEGGYLVSGLTSRVAFKITDQYGKGIDMAGAIVNEKNDTIAVFKPLKFGIGQFTFTPAANSSYKAVIKTHAGRISSYELPSIQGQGYVMHVAEQDASQLKVTIKTNLPASQNAQQAYLIIHTRQALKLAESAGFRNGLAEFIVPKAKLGDGISQLTVFNAARQAVCERLYFKQPVQKLTLDAQINKAEYNSRQKVDVSILTKNENAQLASAALSMSVYRIDSLSLPDEGSLLSYLWLGSDLKGKIESPDYYLTQTGSEATQAIDNLMMTHGWRRFNWQELVRNEIPAFEFIPEYNGHIVRGKIINAATGAPVTEVHTYLAIPGTGSHLYISESNNKGEVLFDLRDYYGSGGIVVQTAPQPGSSYRIDIKNPFSEELSAIPFAPFRLAQNFQQPLVSQSVSMQVQQAYFADSLAQFSSPSVDSLAFYGNPDFVYLLDDYTRFTNMEEVLFEYVTQVVLIKKNGQPYPHVIRSNEEGYMQGDPLVLLDGVPVFGNKIISYDPLKVKRLNIIRSRYVLGPTIFDGIIHFSTYKGDMEGLEFDPGTVVMDYEGLQLKREFYSPDYDNSASAYSTLPDLRNLLFWSPGIQTDAQGKAQLHFFTSDLNGKYIGVLEGMDENGRAGKQVFTFEVKNAQGL